MTLETHTAPPGCILIAEDNLISREMLLHQLQILGFDAVAAEDGLEAARHWRSRRFDLLLTDLQMPGLDGFQLTALIRAEEDAGSRLPILALTANRAEAERESCLEAGMDGCMSKPVSLPALKEALATWIRSTAPAPTRAPAPL
ncbi:MAG: response regulator [Caldimonas sp.]